ncbi:MAG: hypothetical protein Q8K96_19150 [Rubrivivax sp.]|nr:hypothetical protein [Rubrivivax sp.]
MRQLTLTLLLASSFGMAGCDMLGIESASAVAARREAEGKAVGAGCRQAARSVEDCYGLNKRSDKAAVFAGWREMNDYMRENKLDAMPASDEPAVALAAAGGRGDAAPAQSTQGEVGKAEKADKPAKSEKPGKAATGAAAKH